MTPHEFYSHYIGLKCHFDISKDYDYTKFGPINVKYETFNKRNDKYFFVKNSKHKDPINLLLANFVKDKNFYIKNLSEQVYDEWASRQSSRYYLFKKDLDCLLTDFNSSLIIDSNFSHPHIIRLFLQKKISLETLIILIDVCGLISRYNRYMKDDPIWKEIHFMYLKYKPFLNYDSLKIRDIILEKFGENQ